MNDWDRFWIGLIGFGIISMMHYKFNTIINLLQQILEKL